jgi:hypothetical protein
MGFKICQEKARELSNRLEWDHFPYSVTWSSNHLGGRSWSDFKEVQKKREGLASHPDAAPCMDYFTRP